MYSNYYYSDLAFESGMIAFLGIFMILVAFIGLISYICQAIALGNMAKAKGRTDGFLGWIPFACTYLLFKLAGGNFVTLLILFGLGFVPFIGPIFSLACSIYVLVMTYKLLKEFGVSSLMIILSYFFLPLLIVSYIKANKRAKEIINSSNHYY